MFFRLLLLFCFSCACFSSNAQYDFPSPPSPIQFVNDYADLLTAAQEEALEQKLRAYQDSSSNQFVLISINSLGPNNLKRYSQGLAEFWGIGQENKNNGLLFLIAKNDREMRIEVGYGLESSLPDLLCSRILDKTVTPAFRVGNFYEGIDSAFSQLQLAAAGTFNTEDFLYEPNRTAHLLFYFFLALFSIMFLIASYPYPERRTYNIGAVLIAVVLVTTLEIMGGILNHSTLLNLAILTGIMGIYIIAWRLGGRATNVAFFKKFPQKIQDAALLKELHYLFAPSDIDAYLASCLQEYRQYRKVPDNTSIGIFRRYYSALNRLTPISIEALFKHMRQHKLLEANQADIDQSLGDFSFGRQLENIRFIIRPRNDYRLRRIGMKLKSTNFDLSVYSPEAINQLNQALDTDLKRFEPHSLAEEIPPSSQRDYFNRSSYYLRCCNNPRENIALNIPSLWKKLQTKFTASYWIELHSKYTEASVNKQEGKVKAQMRQIESLGPQSPQAHKVIEALYFDYYEKLVYRPTTSGILVRQTTSSSSGGFSSGSSSSFGGGSFGGGGASGSW